MCALDDTGNVAKVALTVPIEGTVRPFSRCFMHRACSDLIPRRDILIPRFVFRDPIA